MLFNSIDFLIFFPIVVLLYLIIPKKTRYIWLLAASYFFYMSWNPKYALLIAFSTLITFQAGILIEKFGTRREKKGVLIVGLCANLGILFFFKYFDFALMNINHILKAFHIQTVDNPFDILLPVGISFYTFQALGYMIDVYRGEIRAERNLLKYALFVSFFPQLVAGPIERSKNLLGQIHELDRKRLWNYDGVVSGLCLMVWGLFQKMVIADRISIFVDAVFENIYMCGTVETVLGAIAFAIQIYCDFSGYSLVAIGAARVMGFELMENFNAPYFAVSIGDFWRRWHISLSTWFRDYLYIPLGGSRCGKLRKYRNLMITFLVSGLWHGAAWNYLVWGGIHGIYRIVGDVTGPMKEKVRKALGVKTEVFSYKFGQVLATFSLTCFAWIFFRAESLEQLTYYMNRMFCRWNPWVLFNGSLFEFGLDRQEVNILFVSILILLLVDLLRLVKNCDLGVFLLKQNLWFRWAVVIMLIVSILVFGEYGVEFNSAQFIYFTF